MKAKIFLVMALIIFSGCDKKATYGFTSGDCNEVYTNCLNKCLQSNKTRTECVNSCERSRSMCFSIKVKGCMQNCNKDYGKDTIQAQSCKNRCSEMR